MRMTEISFEGPPPIDAYGGGGFRVQGEFRPGDMAILQEAPSDWSPSAPLTVDDFAPALAKADEIDILLVGMGAEIAPLPGAVRTALEAAGIGVEVMSTASACRTYNVLLSEGRLAAVMLRAV